MPRVNDQDLTPDEAVAMDLCPECARALSETNPGEHAMMHWPARADAEGKRREKLILDWAAAHPKEEPKKD